jgi:hypothetical protein
MRVHLLSDFKLCSTVTFHLSNGSLLVRQETSIAPLTAERELTGRSAFLLREIVDSECSNVCPHVRWQHLGLELCCGPNSGNDYPSSLSADCLRSRLSREDFIRKVSGDDIGRQLSIMDDERILEFDLDNRYATADPWGRCRGRRLFSWRHLGPGCYDSTAVPRTVLEDALGFGLKCALLHHQPCSNQDCDRRPTRFTVNLVRACEICATDMCVSAQDVADVGRVITLTTWKNLGGVYDGQWASWYTHYSDVDEFTRRFLVNPKYLQTIRDLSKGTAVYAAFENPPTATPEQRNCRYRASIGKRHLAALKGEPSFPCDDWCDDWWTLPPVGLRGTRLGE